LFLALVLHPAPHCSIDNHSTNLRNPNPSSTTTHYAKHLQLNQLGLIAARDAPAATATPAVSQVGSLRWSAGGLGIGLWGRGRGIPLSTSQDISCQLSVRRKREQPQNSHSLYITLALSLPRCVAVIDNCVCVWVSGGWPRGCHHIQTHPGTKTVTEITRFPAISTPWELLLHSNLNMTRCLARGEQNCWDCCLAWPLM